MKAKELTQIYLNFFKSKGHVIVPSASIIPENDPTVLFTSAGMQPMVPFLVGEIHPLGNKIVDIQKCLRTVDFDIVGDNTHNTFFQMLGNWSFGDYFKLTSIEYGFEFLTSKDWLNLDLSKLAFTVYEGDNSVPKDQEAYEKWIELGITRDRLAFLGKDNFWSAGEFGPCGPSSEIFFWTGDTAAPAIFDPEDETWVEIWNHVFMTYNRTPEGLEELEKKNIDTGMGFERTLAVLNGKKSAYETDLFSNIIKRIEELSEKDYETHKRSMRIISDHIRSSVFILGDERRVVPSNMDQGYVLRRLIRRAIRQFDSLGVSLIDIDATSEIAEVVIEDYKDEYPELETSKEFILSELKKEEEKFEKTLKEGLKEFTKISTKMLEHNGTKISGKVAFLLFQSYGFPLEMTVELANEKEMTVDVKGFTKAFEKHQEASKKGSEQKFKGGLSDNSEATTNYHTATHILGTALRKVLNDDSIAQKGSNITAERLRFDFNFDRKLTDEEKLAIETEVNSVIEKQIEVTKIELPLKEALDSGAKAEFGARYPDIVSIYSIGDYSKEICMGPHAKNTKALGKFKIKKEQSSAAGIRRIKAVLILH